MTTQAQPRIRDIAISTYVTQRECSADHAVVRIKDHRAACAYGHRWIEDGDGWRYVGTE